MRLQRGAEAEGGYAAENQVLPLHGGADVDDELQRVGEPQREHAHLVVGPCEPQRLCERALVRPDGRPAVPRPAEGVSLSLSVSLGLSMRLSLRLSLSLCLGLNLSPGLSPSLTQLEPKLAR